MVGILVDTNIWIDILRQMHSKGSRFLDFVLMNHSNIYISPLTVAELWAGKSMDQKNAVESVGNIVSGCKILHPTTLEFKLAGEISRKKLHRISLTDAVIAATAINANMQLLTLDTKDFQSIPNLNLIDHEEL